MSDARRGAGSGLLKEAQRIMLANITAPSALFERLKIRRLEIEMATTKHPEIKLTRTAKGIRWRAVHTRNAKKLSNGNQAYSRLRDLEQGMLDTREAIDRYFAAKQPRRHK